MALLDLLVGGKRPKASPTVTLGTGGTAVYGGYIETTERNPELVPPKRYLTYSEILANSSIVAAGVRYFLNLIAKSGWKVEPSEKAGSQAEAKRIAELVEEMLADMTTPWHRVVRRTAMFKFHGFSIQEWTAKRREDGTLGMKDVEPRPQATIEKWDVDRTGTVVGVVQRSPQDQAEYYLPRGKVIYAVDDSLSDSPEGLGLFRHLAEPWSRLKQFHYLEAFGYETDLRGVPVIRAPLAELDNAVQSGRMTQSQKEGALQPFRDFLSKHVRRPDQGLLMDSRTYESLDESATPSSVRQWEVETLTGDSAQSSVAVNVAVERLNREMARIIGVEHLLLGDGAGSHALARDKTQQFALQADSTLLELTETYEKDYVGTLVTLNGWDPLLAPTLKTEPIRYRDIEQITGALSEMARAGAVLAPEDPAVNEVRDLLGLSHAVVVDLEPVNGFPGEGKPGEDDPFEDEDEVTTAEEEEEEE